MAADGNSHVHRGRGIERNALHGKSCDAAGRRRAVTWVDSQSRAEDPEASRPGVFLMTNTLETGGSERQFVTMANALDPELFRVSAGCLSPIGPLRAELDRVDEFPAGGSLFGLRSWRSRLRLAQFLRREKIAVAHAFDFYSNLMLIPAARLAGVPVVLGSHRQIGDLLTARQFQAQNAAFRLCDRVVCNSGAAAGRLEQSGIRKSKLAIVPNGLPDELFFSTPPALPREPNVVRIGMIARMNHAVKRHDLFLRVAARLARRIPQLQFVLIGDGPLRAGLEALTTRLQLSNPELKGRVLFLGDRRDIPAVLSSLDITVLPSASESLSNVILESMAAAVPVIAARVGGNPEVVQDGRTGFLFNPDDEESFAATLEALAMQPGLRKKVGSAAREEAWSGYSIARVRDRYQELYRSLLEEKGRGSATVEVLAASADKSEGAVR